MKPANKPTKKQTATGPHTQYAALPWRVTRGAEILLLTSRRTRRWVIPKGWPMRARKPHEVAAIEAQEEAGLLGKIDKRKLGSYQYLKRLKNGATALCKVDVFPLSVARQRKSWPEKGERLTRWFSYKAAAERVSEDELKGLILAFGDALTRTLAVAEAGSLADRALGERIHLPIRTGW